MGRLGRIEEKDGDLGGMCELGWGGIWGVGELTYLFLINFFVQIRAKNPRLIGFLTGNPLFLIDKKATYIK